MSRHLFPVILALLATQTAIEAAEIKKPAGPVFGSTTPAPGAFRGLVYRLPKNTSALPNFATFKPVGEVYTTRLNYPLQNYGDEWFGIDYTGRFYVTTPGDYYFQLTVDDGGQVKIDGKTVVANDGVHAAQTEEGRVRLTAGWHEMRVSYFQGPVPYIALVLEVEPPKGKRRIFDLIDFQPPPDAPAPESRPTLRRN